MPNTTATIEAGRRVLPDVAAEHLRGLIEKIVLTPEKGREDLRIDLHGDLAGILSIASRKQARPRKVAYDNLSGPNKCP